MSRVQAIPTIETERLVLRAPSVNDFHDSAAMWGDREVTRHIGGRPFTEEEVWARLMRYVGHWALLGFGYWVVCERGTDRYVGEVGFADFRREMEPSLGGAPEAGWVLAPWAHGKGYATEAARAALAWGESHFGKARTVCIINPSNAPSIRVANKIGYVEVGPASYKGEKVILFERL